MRARIHRTVKDTNYTRKITPGRLIGLQNLIPQIQQQSETVYFTDNHMVTQLYEVNVEELRKILDEDSEATVTAS